MPSIGDELLDGYKATSSWFHNGIKSIDDYADFFKERAAIEREASQKLTALTAKHFSRKAGQSAQISVGDVPATTPGSLESATLTAWTEVLTQTEEIAKQHHRLSEEFGLQIGDQLASLRTRFDALYSQFNEFDAKALNDRDKIYDAVKKAKSVYDDTCQSMENARAKGKKMDVKEQEMSNAKSSYLIAINVANRIKDKYYHDDLPELLDCLQLAAEARIAQANRILKTACELESAGLERNRQSLASIVDVVSKNQPALNTAMFLDHNRAPWQDPTDYYFQPSQVWHDEGNYKLDENGLRYLRGRLSAAENALDKATAESEEAMDRYETASKAAKDANYGDNSGGAIFPLLKNYAYSLQKLEHCETTRIAYEVEIEAVEAATAGCDLSGVPITRTKTTRGLFGKKKEIVEVVEAKNGGHGGGPRLGIKSLLARTARATGISHSLGGPTAHIIYDFESGGPDELSVTAGDTLRLLQPDDGSGWIKVEKNGQVGVVPATYAEITNTEKAGGGSSAPPPPPPSRGTKTMLAIYDYDATASDQLSIRVDDKITVIEPDTGSGWTTGEIHGKRGIFPTTYAQ